MSFAIITAAAAAGGSDTMASAPPAYSVAASPTAASIALARWDAVALELANLARECAGIGQTTLLVPGLASVPKTFVLSAHLHMGLFARDGDLLLLRDGNPPQMRTTPAVAEVWDTAAQAAATQDFYRMLSDPHIVDRLRTALAKYDATVRFRVLAVQPWGLRFVLETVFPRNATETEQPVRRVADEGDGDCCTIL